MASRFLGGVAAIGLLTFGGSIPAAPGAELLEPLKRNGEVITASWQSGALPANPTSREWQRIRPATVTLYPQTSLRPKRAAGERMALHVRTLYNGSELALHLQWADRARDSIHDIGRFPDALAIQWPSRYGHGIKLPYVGMGHAGQPVAVWFWRADGRVETLAAEGFGSLTPQPSDGILVNSVWKKGQWSVVLKRSLRTEPGASVQFDPAVAGLVPVAFAVWSGEAGQRDGDKRFSSWRFLNFERGAVDPRYVAGLAWAPRIKGDPKAGKKLMTAKGCVACHSYPGNPIPAEAGPDLTWAGGIHRPEYLLESIEEPSAIIVPDRRFHTVQHGETVSIMPKAALSSEELFHLVEHLRTFGR